MFAVFKNHSQIVKRLILSGADISVKNMNGITAIQLAEEKGYTEISVILKNIPDA